MKKVFSLFFTLLSFNVFAAQVDIISAEYPVQDYDGRESLCLTVIRVPKTNGLIGIVESIEDCFYTRKAIKSLDNKMEVPLHKLQKITDRKLKQHLQRIDPQLEFYFSDGD